MDKRRRHEIPRPTRKAVPQKAVAANFYSLQAWKKDRRAHLNTNPFCASCTKGGQDYVIATVSDHIVPIQEGGDVWDWANRQPLCERCHNVKRAHERARRQRTGDAAAQSKGG